MATLLGPQEYERACERARGLLSSDLYEPYSANNA